MYYNKMASKKRLTKQLNKLHLFLNLIYYWSYDNLMLTGCANLHNYEERPLDDVEAMYFLIV